MRPISISMAFCRSNREGRKEGNSDAVAVSNGARIGEWENGFLVLCKLISRLCIAPVAHCEHVECDVAASSMRYEDDPRSMAGPGILFLKKVNKTFKGISFTKSRLEVGRVSF